MCISHLCLNHYTVENTNLIQQATIYKETRQYGLRCILYLCYPKHRALCIMGLFSMLLGTWYLFNMLMGIYQTLQALELEIIINLKLKLKYCSAKYPAYFPGIAVNQSQFISDSFISIHQSRRN